MSERGKGIDLHDEAKGNERGNKVGHPLKERKAGEHSVGESASIEKREYTTHESSQIKVLMHVDDILTKKRIPQMGFTTFRKDKTNGIKLFCWQITTSSLPVLFVALLSGALASSAPKAGAVLPYPGEMGLGCTRVAVLAVPGAFSSGMIKASRKTRKATASAALLTPGETVPNEAGLGGTGVTASFFAANCF